MKDRIRFARDEGSYPGCAPGASGGLVHERSGRPGVRRQQRAESPRSARRRSRGGGRVRILAGRADGRHDGLLGVPDHRCARPRACRCRAARHPARWRRGRATGERAQPGGIGRRSRTNGRRRELGPRIVMLGLTNGGAGRPLAERPAQARAAPRAAAEHEVGSRRGGPLGLSHRGGGRSRRGASSHLT
jgi:hypothetical protein